MKSGVPADQTGARVLMSKKYVEWRFQNCPLAGFGYDPQLVDFLINSLKLAPFGSGLNGVRPLGLTEYNRFPVAHHPPQHRCHHA